MQQEKLEKYLNSLTYDTLKQVLRFILEPDSQKETVSKIIIIKNQVYCISLMYPEFDGEFKDYLEKYK